MRLSKEKNISLLSNCYGCGLCAASCPKNIIEVKLNSEGFYEPFINNNDACIECGICVNVCSYADEEIAVKESSPIACYAAWSNNSDVRKNCSSGGVGYEIAKKLVDEGYKFVGVKYDSFSNRALHYISDSKDGLLASMGSKYIQSYTVDAFRSINRKEKYIVTGTPCQIDSFRRYIRKFKCEDNFVLLDFFCHGVPTMNLWKKYTDEAKKIIGEIVGVSWRNKTNGWHDSYDLLIKGEKDFMSSRWSQGDFFFKIFLSNSCLGKACYRKCKFKGKYSAADIRIGDLWGETYKNDDKGVSGVLAFTAKGDIIINQSNCTLKVHSYDTVVEAQLGHKLREPLSYNFVCWLLKKRIPLRIIYYVVQMTRLPYLIKCKLKL